MATAKKAAAKTSTAKKAAKKSASTQPKPAAAVDRQLARYRSMRDFEVTAEPSGSTKSNSASNALPFVIQKHAASHLHYDFRLAWNGVLKSWAVAKGPSYYTGDRRLAVEVEDHPIEYGGFEGIIPKGQYGGGTVMVWDTGTWHPQPGYEDVTAGLKAGSLKFILNGKKLHGKWTLVRMKDRPGTKPSSKPNWLLIKEHDDFERTNDAEPITDQSPNSALTGRTMEQIAAQQDHVWNSKESAHNQPQTRAAPKPPSKAKPTPAPRNLSHLPKEPQPSFIPPQLAFEASSPPDAPGWLHELKVDGYRIQARKSGPHVKLLTRKGLDWTHRMRGIAAAIAKLPAHDVTLDGEVVVFTPDGTTSFADLQAAFQEGAHHHLTYVLFDLLHLNGHSTRGLPLRDRKQLLADLLKDADADTLHYSDHLETGGEKLFREASRLGAEGIISKRADASYTSGRNNAWLKIKARREQELVIGGFTTSTEGPGLLGALLLGYYERGKLVYAGRTGTGFTHKLKRELHARLAKLTAKSAPFAAVPRDAQKGAYWVTPKLVAQVAFANWTADNLVRQAAFLGLREDKPATEVAREGPTAKADASHQAVSPTTAKPSTAKRTNHSSPTTNHSLRLTHPDKILDPTSKLTKQQLADYYTAIAPHLLPHIANRPLSLLRCPDGTTGQCFFQKHVTTALPPGLETVMVTDKKSGKAEPYITLSTVEAIPGLAQIGALEIHPWSSTNDNLEHPDRIILDLDPDPTLPWSTLAAAAKEVRTRLKKAGLESFLKTTGGKGLHIVAPIETTVSWDELKTFAHNLVLAMERAQPNLYLTKMTKAARTGKIFLDYLRNERGATAVAPYSPRARAGVPVSLPLPWSALSQKTHPLFTVSDFSHWRNRLRADPWKTMLKLHQKLPAAKQVSR